MVGAPASWPSRSPSVWLAAPCQCLGSPNWAPSAWVSPTSWQGIHSISLPQFFKRQNTTGACIKPRGTLETGGCWKPYQFYWGDRPPVSSRCWHSVWHHWSSMFPLQGNKLHFPKWKFWSPSCSLETPVSSSSEPFTFSLLFHIP